MNYSFTDQVRAALAHARDEAIRYRHDYVGTEHLLLGLTMGNAWAAGLEWMDVDADAVRSRVDESVRKGKADIPLGELPYTSRAKKVLEFAMAEAREFGHSYVGTQHLLLGLQREEKGIAAQVLWSLGVTLDDVRPQALAAGAYGQSVAPRRGTEHETGASESAQARDRGDASQFAFSIDDASSSSIYEQIIAQVNEAVATGALPPGQRLPTVRRLADELDIAPGTVARAYGELERQGVVKTEGARGTRVAERPRDAQPPDERRETLVGLLRPVAVAAFHLGATSDELREALERAMSGVLGGRQRNSDAKGGEG